MAARRTLAAFALTAGIVYFRIDPEQRASFKRCRRQWDFASRRRLEPVDAAGPALPAALKDALAVYYYPGTWDWQHDLKQSLVRKAVERSLNDAGAGALVEAATALLDGYDAWASTIDDFAPVKIDHDVAGLLTDPAETERGLLTPNGSGIVYTCRVDLLAVDAADDYWVVRHQTVDDWQERDALVRDEEAIAACWAWEQDYVGMEIVGTIHNEVRIDGPLDLPSTADPRHRKPVAQHEASGGGRSIPQHQRVSARPSRVDVASRVDQHIAGPIRRTRIRRTRQEIADMGRQLAAEALDMVFEPTIYPSPAAHCSVCEFAAPCLALFEGADPEPILEARFRQRPVSAQPKPRLGQATWGFGRGAAPPKWDDQ
ncbi:hypothetical protein [Mycolicibacterium moriokaense]|uniref:PD-(D/E)XK endonuclease-like domain-containing protein n=1 Tax=Mycolicibacterium moriokaense TaxID=39691 RepID=A0A318HL20_9MYCO|nr:hypothetical protein [Mycolicibacterium moriokaense]PXX11101.1 hypothetical protein C8E89_103188 [Mycolicibacterium moriokaense]